MGGYLALNYYMSDYCAPNSVTQLILLSPVGIPREPTNEQKEEVEARKAAGSGLFQKLSQAAKQKFWANNFSPVSLLRAGGTLSANKILTDYVNERTLIFDENEKKLWIEFNKQSLLR